jgi:hypothetical protein
LRCREEGMGRWAECGSLRCCAELTLPRPVRHGRPRSTGQQSRDARRRPATPHTYLQHLAPCALDALHKAVQAVGVASQLAPLQRGDARRVRRGPCAQTAGAVGLSVLLIHVQVGWINSKLVDVLCQRPMAAWRCRPRRHGNAIGRCALADGDEGVLAVLCCCCCCEGQQQQ